MCCVYFIKFLKVVCTKNQSYYLSTKIHKYLVDNMKCFRKLKETTWIKTEDQLNENSIVVKGLEPGHTYQFRVVAVDGE